MRTWAIAVSVVPALAALASGAGEFRAGAAQVEITPPAGTPMAGSYALRPSHGTLDPLFAKAIVVEKDGEAAALVALDLAYTTRPCVEEARRRIAAESGIPGERVMISATHTHSGPVQTRGNLMDKITGADKPVAIEFTARLPGLIAGAVASARSNLAPARASALVVREEGVSFNRRYWLKDGSLGWMTARSPNVVRPAGPIDPDVGLCYFEGAGEKGASLGAYVNFAMHATVVGGSKFSADYCGAVGRHLAGFKGAGLVTLFANGCCGNVNQINPAWPGQGNGPLEADRIGTVLAGDLFRDWWKLQPLRTAAPRARSKLVKLERRKVSAGDVAGARKVIDRIGKEPQRIPVMADAVCILESDAKKDVPLEAEVQAIAFSDDLVIVALPGEIFAELGLALKKASPFRHTFVAELANGSIGYVPNREAYAEGNYEVVSARGVEGSGEMLVDTAVKLLKEIAKP